MASPRPSGCSPSGTCAALPPAAGRAGPGGGPSCRCDISLARPMSAIACAIRSASSARCSGERLRHQRSLRGGPAGERVDQLLEDLRVLREEVAVLVHEVARTAGRCPRRGRRRRAAAFRSAIMSLTALHVLGVAGVLQRLLHRPRTGCRAPRGAAGPGSARRSPGPRASATGSRPAPAPRRRCRSGSASSSASASRASSSGSGNSRAARPRAPCRAARGPARACRRAPARRGPRGAASRTVGAGRPGPGGPRVPAAQQLARAPRAATLPASTESPISSSGAAGVERRRQRVRRRRATAVAVTADAPLRQPSRQAP